MTSVPASLDKAGSSPSPYGPAPDEQTPLLAGTDPETEILTASISPSTSYKSSPATSKGTDEEAPDASLCSNAEPEPTTTTGIAGIISVLLLGCFIANADGSIVVATYGIISSETGNLSNGSWLIVTFMLAVCAVQPTYGKMSDLYGRKSALIVAYTLFTIGCALWSFYIQCPLTVTAIVLVVWKLGSPPEQHNITTADEGTTTTKGKLRRVDFLGSISLALTIVGFLLVLDLGGQKLPWGHPLIWIIFAAASLSSIAFALIEAFVAREPIYPLRLLVHRDVISAYIVTVLLGSAQFGVIEDNQCVMYTVPLYFQVTARASVTNAGFHLFPAVCGNAIAGLISGVIIKKTASYKTLTIIGTLSSILCYALLTFLWRGNTNIWESLFIAPGGFGMGIALSTTFVYIAAAVEPSQMAIASTGLYLNDDEERVAAGAERMG
ncbi:MAG: hypothetical protein L6R40_008294 [Gallowayella cf. fulva]|nr:MAG: hypothetical protein L6R40_008294 [Xanthomendoza cf. fulva]